MIRTADTAGMAMSQSEDIIVARMVRLYNFHFIQDKIKKKDVGLYTHM